VTSLDEESDSWIQGFHAHCDPARLHRVSICPSELVRVAYSRKPDLRTFQSGESSMLLGDGGRARVMESVYVESRLRPN
jgi:hypothetical protein